MAQLNQGAVVAHRLSTREPGSDARLEPSQRRGVRVDERLGPEACRPAVGVCQTDHVAFHRDVDPAKGEGPDQVANVGGTHEVRRDRRAGTLGDGTLACPDCDFPTSPTAPAMRPSDALWCSYCGRHGAVREFLTLSDEPRPARVTVVVRLPPLPAATRGRARP